MSKAVFNIILKDLRDLPDGLRENIISKNPGIRSKSISFEDLIKNLTGSKSLAPNTFKEFLSKNTAKSIIANAVERHTGRTVGLAELAGGVKTTTAKVVEELDGPTKAIYYKDFLKQVISISPDLTKQEFEEIANRNGNIFGVSVKKRELSGIKKQGTKNAKPSAVRPEKVESTENIKKGPKVAKSKPKTKKTSVQGGSGAAPKQGFKDVLNAFVKRYEGMFKEYPDVKDEFRNLVENADKSKLTEKELKTLLNKAANNVGPGAAGTGSASPPKPNIGSTADDAGKLGKLGKLGKMRHIGGIALEGILLLLQGLTNLSDHSDEMLQMQQQDQADMSRMASVSPEAEAMKKYLESVAGINMHQSTVQGVPMQEEIPQELIREILMQQMSGQGNMETIEGERVV